jgi:penicillin-binding protein 1A
MTGHLRLRGTACLAAVVLATSLASPAWSASRVYDARGTLITELRGRGQHAHVPLADISPLLQKAVIAVEDSRFYDHRGIDLRGVARALVVDVLRGGRVQGGSTITQQLVKNRLQNRRKTLQRKVNEALMALELEQQHSKDEILEMYLNEVYWGSGATGIEEAAQTYFRHSCRSMTLQEAALLAGMLKGPERYNPFRNPELAFSRSSVVLDRMTETGVITAEEADRARRKRPVMPRSPGEIGKAPYFLQYLTNRLGPLLEAQGINPYRDDLTIHTTLDLPTQAIAEDVITDLVRTQGPRFGFDQAALVALNPSTGGILAMVGGSGYRESPYNRATTALRQPGSTFKPFVYLTAFLRGISSELREDDTPVTYRGANGKPYTPRNYRGEKEGTMTLRRALELSNNVITTKLLNRLGPASVIEVARKAGLSSPMQETLSLGLGAYEVTPLELAHAYATLAREGVRTGVRVLEESDPGLPPSPAASASSPALVRMEPWSCRAITLGDRPVPVPRVEAVRVFEAAPVRLLTDVMRGVILRGTGTAANPGRPAAGKTGTTSDSRDAWFVGYTPQLVTVIWVGNDDNHKMHRNVAGGTVVAPSWKRFVTRALARVPVLNFAPPPAIAAPAPVASGSTRPAKPPSTSSRPVVVTTPQPVVSAPPPPSEGDPDLVEEAEGDF